MDLVPKAKFRYSPRRTSGRSMADTDSDASFIERENSARHPRPAEGVATTLGRVLV